MTKYPLLAGLNNLELYKYAIAFVLVIGFLVYKPELWPLLFAIPLLMLVYAFIDSRTKTSRAFKTDPKASLLTGHLNYGIDSKGRRTRKFYLK
jgi:hypothetical protein